MAQNEISTQYREELECMVARAAEFPGNVCVERLDLSSSELPHSSNTLIATGDNNLLAIAQTASEGILRPIQIWSLETNSLVCLVHTNIGRSLHIDSMIVKEDFVGCMARGDNLFAQVVILTSFDNMDQYTFPGNGDRCADHKFDFNIARDLVAYIHSEDGCCGVKIKKISTCEDLYFSTHGRGFCAQNEFVSDQTLLALCTNQNTRDTFILGWLQNDILTISKFKSSNHSRIDCRGRNFAIKKMNKDRFVTEVKITQSGVIIISRKMYESINPCEHLNGEMPGNIAYHIQESNFDFNISQEGRSHCYLPDVLIRKIQLPLHDTYPLRYSQRVFHHGAAFSLITWKANNCYIPDLYGIVCVESEGGYCATSKPPLPLPTPDNLPGYGPNVRTEQQLVVDSKWLSGVVSRADQKSVCMVKLMQIANKSEIWVYFWKFR